MGNTGPQLRDLVVQKFNEGLSMPNIAAFTNLDRTAVSCILKRYKEQGHHNDASHSGQPSKRTTHHVHIILEHDCHQTLTDITSIINTSLSSPVSPKTVGCLLHNQLGLFGRISAKKPFLKPEHRVARLEWAMEHRVWNLVDWKCVIWTDESSVEIGKDSRRGWVCRRPGEIYEEKCLKPTFKSGRTSLMIWGCMAYGELGLLVRILKEERSGVDYVRLVLGGPLWDF
jgi:transposase